MTTKTYRIEWQGDNVAELVKAAVKVGLAAWAEYHEDAARAAAPELTGRLIRSIHAAAPSHNWAGDFSPGRGDDLGGIPVEPDENGSVIAVAVGTGLFYGAFQEKRQAFVARSHDQTIGRLDGELEAAGKAAGLH